jgi:hypothetical protein
VEVPTATFAWRREGCLAGPRPVRRLYLLITRSALDMTKFVNNYCFGVSDVCRAAGADAII